MFRIMWFTTLGYAYYNASVGMSDIIIDNYIIPRKSIVTADMGTVMIIPPRSIDEKVTTTTTFTIMMPTLFYFSSNYN